MAAKRIIHSKYPYKTMNPKTTVSPDPLTDWIDSQDVITLLHISSRTLQTLRRNGTLPYSRIGRKLFYKRTDIQRILQNNYIMFEIRNKN